MSHAGHPERDRWDSRFGGEDFYFGTAPNAFLAAQKDRLRKGASALAICDGEGRNGVWLAEQGLAVTSFDFSPNGVAKAQKLAASRGVTIDCRLASILDWDWDARRYDVIAAIFFQFATPAQREVIFAGFVRALAPGGLLILQGYRPEQIAYGTGGPPWPEHLYTEALLRSSFAALEILHLAAHDDAVSEGKGHIGMSALIDLVARKPAG